MPIVRGHHAFDDHFTQIPNEWLRDARLSLKARGLLALIMSHRPGWNMSIRSLAKSNDIGVDAIRSAINELIQFGYLSRSEERERDESGHLTDYTYTTHDPSDFPTLDNPTLDNPTTKKNISKEEHLQEVNAQSSIDDLRGEFEKWWAVYPRKVGRTAAFKAYQRVRDHVSAETLQTGVQRLARDPNLPEKRYIPHPATWINEGRWDDEPYPARERSKEQLARDELERIKERQERDRANSARLAEEMRLARENAAPMPTCEHGMKLVTCRECVSRLAEEENN